MNIQPERTGRRFFSNVDCNTHKNTCIPSIQVFFLFRNTINPWRKLKSRTKVFFCPWCLTGQTGQPRSARVIPNPPTPASLWVMLDKTKTYQAYIALLSVPSTSTTNFRHWYRQHSHSPTSCSFASYSVFSDSWVVFSILISNSDFR